MRARVGSQKVTVVAKLNFLHSIFAVLCGVAHERRDAKRVEKTREERRKKKRGKAGRNRSGLRCFYEGCNCKPAHLSSYNRHDNHRRCFDVADKN